MTKIWKQQRAFSLIEMLGVLAIIGVMFAFSAPMWMAQSTMELNGASLRLAGFFEEARAEAVAWGEPVRVLIHEDTRYPGQYLRRATAVRREEKSDPEAPPDWVPILHPLMLPAGVFFDPAQPGIPNQRMRLVDAGNAEVSWLYYEIGPDGFLEGDDRNVVLGKGTMESSASQVQFPNPEQIAGFRLGSRTHPIHFRSREDILRSVN